MYEGPTEEASAVLPKTDHLVFYGEEDVSGYNNHAYLARYDGLFWAIWSCGARDGGFPGQHVRYATSTNGMDWSAPGLVVPSRSNETYIARGLWVRDGELLALAARGTNEPPNVDILSLDAYRWDGATEEWLHKGVLADRTINNYAPLRLPTGDWLMTYRYRELNRVDGVLVGGVTGIDQGRANDFPNPGDILAQFTEADSTVRADGAVAVHFRDNGGGRFLYRAVSTNNGATFSAPVQTDFPDCTCKHYCTRLSNGMYILINNPHTRNVLQMAGSPDGEVFTHAARLRYEPVALRYPGHDKGGAYTYPHAIEHDGYVYAIYAVNRDDIYVSRVWVGDIERLLSDAQQTPKPGRTVFRDTFTDGTVSPWTAATNVSLSVMDDSGGLGGGPALSGDVNASINRTIVSFERVALRRAGDWIEVTLAFRFDGVFDNDRYTPAFGLFDNRGTSTDTVDDVGYTGWFSSLPADTGAGIGREDSAFGILAGNDTTNLWATHSSAPDRMFAAGEVYDLRMELQRLPGGDLHVEVAVGGGRSMLMATIEPAGASPVFSFNQFGFRNRNNDFVVDNVTVRCGPCTPGTVLWVR